MARPGRRALVLGALAVAAAGPLLAAPPDPAAPVVRVRAGLMAMSAHGWPPTQEAVEGLLARNFDLDDIARAVLGPQAPPITPAQSRRLSHALGLRLARELVRAPPPGEGDGFAVVGRRSIGPGEWLVTTRGGGRGGMASPEAPDQPLVLTWRIKMSRGSPRIVDTLRDGVSSVAVQRQDLAGALHGRTPDQVIDLIERRAGSGSR